MDESSKKSYTNAFFKREPEDNLESKLNLVIETMERLSDRLQRIEAKVDLLATKADLHTILISDKGKNLFSTNFRDGGSGGSWPYNNRDGGSGGPLSSNFRDGGTGGPLSSNFRDGGSGDPFSSNFRGGNKNLLDKKNPFQTAFNSAAYTPPQSRIFGGGDDQTIIVKGFDSSLPEDDIRSTLWKYFCLYGEITSVVVPTDHKTGAVIGCAYIQLKEGVEKALKLSGSYLGGWKLVVEKASPIGDVGGRFGPSGREGHWPFPYRCNGLGRCSFC